MRGGSVADKLARKVVVDEHGCWIWTGAIQSRGYGHVNVAPGQMKLTHRASYELHVGPIPEGMQLDHLCRVRACCNPAHLEPVTGRENLRRSPLIGGKTHCANGHEYSAETLLDWDSHRRCRICRAATKKASYERKKLLHPA